jgi:hypothetical protein
MKAQLTLHTHIALSALVCVLALVVSAWYINRTFADMEHMLEERINERVRTLGSLAEITDRNGADPLTESIIGDCPRRGEFENLLNNLGTATRRDLMATQQLFESCGAFYAERKALMVAELKRQYEAVEESLALLTEIRDLTHEERMLTSWKELIALEAARSASLTEQTEIQAEIITLLIAGAPAEQIRERAQEAQNIAESLSVEDANIDTLRKSLGA